MLLSSLRRAALAWAVAWPLRTIPRLYLRPRSIASSTLRSRTPGCQLGGGNAAGKWTLISRGEQLIERLRNIERGWAAAELLGSWRERPGARRAASGRICLTCIIESPTRLRLLLLRNHTLDLFVKLWFYAKAKKMAKPVVKTKCCLWTLCLPGPERTHPPATD